MITCIFSDVSERDMDLLISEEIFSLSDFLALFLQKVGIVSATVSSVELSKSDAVLGESDITVIIESSGEKIGLLIEDKIDAIAMPDQAMRYILRGQKGIEQGDFTKFYVFIVAPQKYLSENREAKKYENCISYEELLEFFSSRKDNRSVYKAQQIKQAIYKQKTGYQIVEDHAVTAFWKQYAKYQKEHFPNVWLIYSGGKKGANASWPRYNTVIKGLYFYHKSEFGYIDLTFENCSERIPELEQILFIQLGDYSANGFSIQRTGKSAALRLIVPTVDFHKPFEMQLDKIKECFAAIQKMSETVKKLNQDCFGNLFLNKLNG